MFSQKDSQNIDKRRRKDRGVLLEKVALPPDAVRVEQLTGPGHGITSLSTGDTPKPHINNHGPDAIKFRYQF
jgi:hypothetical protein